jgi:16S rRNA (guanine(966)-N(2))-methyltransferase RsmD
MLGCVRIIAGSLRSRRFEAPPGLATRPTSDRLRETLFNVLAPRIEGAEFLDLYAGSGAVGMEALSRGAARVVFVERAAEALKVLRANLTRLGLELRVEVRTESAGAYLKHAAEGAGFDVVFLDPPYDEEAEYDTALGLLGGAIDTRSQQRDLGRPLLKPGAVVVAEHRRKDTLAENYGGLKRTRLLQQGDAALSFYQIMEPGAAEKKGSL